MAVEYTGAQVAAQLCEFLRSHVLAADVEVGPDTDLSAIGVDSFSLMELVLFIERRFGLELPAEALTPAHIANAGVLGAYCVDLLHQQHNADR